MVCSGASQRPPRARGGWPSSGTEVSARRGSGQGFQVLWPVVRPGSGDGPLSVRGCPSTVKGTRRSFPTAPQKRSSGPALDRGASAPPPSRNQGPGGSLPGPTRAIPCTVQAVMGQFHDPEWARNDVRQPKEKQSGPSRQVHRFARSQGLPRSRMRARYVPDDVGSRGNPRSVRDTCLMPLNRPRADQGRSRDRLLSSRSSRPAERARSSQNEWGMAVTHEPSQIAMTPADLLRSTSYALSI